jgi:alkanesulfonate monooxygenase SsuD/methylene tetrahydromethanopterin reductase-like flavin-dependent oxidoreductase (luciferase family)
MAAGRVRFDMFIWQVVPWPQLRDDVRYLETLDIGTVWLGDKYEVPESWFGQPAAPWLEAWTTLGALATCTSRVRLGTLVSDLLLRHPAMLAKQAATLDRLSDGRLDLGIGSGDAADEQAAWLGLPVLSPGRRVDRLGEAVEVIDRLLRDRRLTYHGEFYQLTEAPFSPTPLQQPRPPLVIAAQGKRALRIAAERADTWITGPSGFLERNRLLDECCRQIGRDPKTVERACGVFGNGQSRPFASLAAFQDFIGRNREIGVERFVFCFGSAADPPPYDGWIAKGEWATRETLESFAAQVMADLRGTK